MKNLGDVYTFKEFYEYYESLDEPSTKGQARSMLINFLYGLNHCSGEGPYMKALCFPQVLLKAIAILTKE